MKKEMLINVLQPEEIRIAIVEDGVLEELYVERTSHESYVGNIYKGRIVNIEPSIQAAFIDFGVGRNGFLHVSDVEPEYYRHLMGPQGRRDDARGRRRGRDEGRGEGRRDEGRGRGPRPEQGRRPPRQEAPRPSYETAEEEMRRTASRRPESSCASRSRATMETEPAAARVGAPTEAPGPGNGP